MENNSSASERWLLRGAPNARDLGGLPTMDGRTIRPGLLLRSGELAGITEPDAQTLTEYPLRTVWISARTSSGSRNRTVSCRACSMSTARACSRRRPA